MSAQFGRWKFDGMDDLEEIVRAEELLAPYGPDGEDKYHRDGVTVIYRALNTTKESILEVQPNISKSGVVVTWDGRLDNREELVGELSSDASLEDSDVSIVASAYDKWKSDCFRKLIGDWAISIWDPRHQSLVLAVDFFGIRHLYYSPERGSITWSTILDPLVLRTRRRLALNEEYIAGWLSSFPAAHLTPFDGINVVPPACFVTLRPGKTTIRKYWDFDGAKSIRYRTDAEYEEHFRAVFGEAVRRRLRSSTPVLAELSGGMDSSSIVCMADRIAGAPRLDTVSFFNDREPHWDERPYFKMVEEQRGRPGLHVEADSRVPSDEEEDAAMLVPGGTRRLSPVALAGWMNFRGHRILLSGTGGDEVTGGVPTPIPELQDLLAAAKFPALARQLKVWALLQKRPWLHLFREAASGFLPPRLLASRGKPGSWLCQLFVSRNQAAFQGYRKRLRLFGPSPSFQENLGALDGLRRQLAATAIKASPPFEKRYPFLDRDLLEFLYAIPREQLVRPGQRRSLMRRALAGIVPDGVLNRRRKAYVSRSPTTTITTQYPRLVDMCANMVTAELGFVSPDAFRNSLEEVRQGKTPPGISLMRTIGIELWLRGLRSHGLFIGKTDTTRVAADRIQVAVDQPHL